MAGHAERRTEKREITFHDPDEHIWQEMQKKLPLKREAYNSPTIKIYKYTRWLDMAFLARTMRSERVRLSTSNRSMGGGPEGGTVSAGTERKRLAQRQGKNMPKAKIYRAREESEKGWTEQRNMGRGENEDKKARRSEHFWFRVICPLCSNNFFYANQICGTSDKHAKLLRRRI